LDNFIEKNKHYKYETDGSKTIGKEFKGIAILLFASRTNEVSTDKPNSAGKIINIGTEKFINIVEKCR
jgi:hypothetical protein